MRITTKKIFSAAKKSGGFTLVEMMIALAISGVIMGAVYSAYLTQQKTYLTQNQVAEMQQNLRAAMFIISRGLRMAGYDLTGKANAGITTALPGQVSFTQDLNVDEDTADSKENISFGFKPTDDPDRDGIPVDADGDGVPDAVSLRMQDNGNYNSLAENIQAIEFIYLDKDSNVTASAADIHYIQLSILARAEKPDRDFINNTTYTPASGTPWNLNGTAGVNAPNDHFRRRLLITTIQCRNMRL